MLRLCQGVIFIFLNVNECGCLFVCVLFIAECCADVQRGSIYFLVSTNVGASSFVFCSARGAAQMYREAGLHAIVWLIVLGNVKSSRRRHMSLHEVVSHAVAMALRIRCAFAPWVMCPSSGHTC